MIRTTIKCERCGELISRSNYLKHTKVCSGEGKKVKPKLSFCPFCKFDLDSSELTLSQRANHVRWCSSNPNRNKRSQLQPRINFKHTEDTKRNHSEIMKLRHVEGRYKHVNESRKGKPGVVHTEATKEKMRIIRVTFLKEHPEKHPWKRSNKQKSHPCEAFKQILQSNEIQFIEEFKPLTDRFFSIDIAFPECKIGIEINGGQHYDKFERLKPYYDNRHKLIVNNGWLLYEIPWYAVFNEEFVDIIIELLKNSISLRLSGQATVS